MSLLDSLKKLFVTRPRISSELELLGRRFQSIFRYEFNNENLLFEALTHRSYTRTADGAELPSYERLEFLGDSVLGLVVAEEMYQRFPDKSEGELTKMKSLLVNETSLARFGGEAGLGEFLRLSPEEERSGGRERSSILADAFEAVLGAIYLDGSIEPVREVVRRLIVSRMDETLQDKSQINYKGELLEIMQGRGENMPQYEVISEAGPDHQKKFVVAVICRNEKLGVGEGLSKKEAEQKAARVALEALRARGEIAAYSDEASRS